jgi:hypothetical protein
MMQSIPISLALAGMVLARDIRSSDDPDSPPVCGKGVTLTESLIKRLDNMGIKAIAVEGHPIKMDGDKTTEEVLAALDRRFRLVREDPLMKKLRDIYREHIIRSMGQ